MDIREEIYRESYGDIEALEVLSNAGIKPFKIKEFSISFFVTDNIGYFYFPKNRFFEKEGRSFDLIPMSDKQTECQVFEKVNTGGVSLTVFELLTATFAAEDYDLKEDWANIKVQFRQFDVLDEVKNTDIMQAVTLLTTYFRRHKRIDKGVLPGELPAVSCKRKDVLNLKLSEYQDYKELVVKGYIKASKILVENHIFSARDLPYNTQLIPFSAILAVLGDKIESIGIRSKIIRWFWCGVFGELYGGANETRYALDL